MTALLEVEDLRVAYGAIEAVKGITFSVEAGQIVTLIGGNGAGKTTSLRALTGAGEADCCDRRPETSGSTGAACVGCLATRSCNAGWRTHLRVAASSAG